MAEVELFRGEPGGFGDAQHDTRRPDAYASTLHGIVAWVLVVLIGLHILAAFKHFFINKDGVFQRMWFGG